MSTAWRSSARGSVPTIGALLILVALILPPFTRGPLPVLAWFSTSPPQGDCRWPYFYTIYAVDTLCCPTGGTFAEFLCENVFCSTIPFGSYRCWQNLALCGVLYCPNQAIQLWREAGWAIHCEVGPIITSKPVPKEL